MQDSEGVSWSSGKNHGRVYKLKKQSSRHLEIDDGTPWKRLEILLMCEFQSKAAVETGSHISSHRSKLRRTKHRQRADVMVNRFLRLQYYSSPFSCKFTSVQFLAKSSTLRPRKVLIRLPPLSMLHPASPCSCGYEVATSEETNVIITRLWRNESVGVRLVTGAMCSLQSLGMAWHGM